MANSSLVLAEPAMFLANRLCQLPGCGPPGS